MQTEVPNTFLNYGKLEMPKTSNKKARAKAKAAGAAKHLLKQTVVLGQKSRWTSPSPTLMKMNAKQEKMKTVKAAWSNVTWS